MRQRIAAFLQALANKISPKDEEWEHIVNPFVVEIGEYTYGADWYAELPGPEGSIAGIAFGDKEHGMKAVGHSFILHFTPDLNHEISKERIPEGYL